MTDLIETSTWLPRRGTSAQIAALTGEAGIDNSGRELVVDTSKATAVLMHAGMPGGVALLREDMANVQAAAGRTALGVDPAGTAAALLATHAAIADPHPDYITPAELAALLAAHFPSGDLPPVSAQVTTDLGRALLAAAGGIAGRALLSAASERQAQYLAWRDYRRGLTTPPAIDPALWLDAALYQTEAHGKPSLASFSRASSASYTDARGRLITAAAGMLRHDFSPATGQYLGWLIEEQRTNLLIRSEAIDNAAWTKLNATLPATSITAPDGMASADELREDTATGVHIVFQAAAGSSTAQHTFSIFAKATANPRRFILDLDDAAANGVRATFDVAAGTVTNITGTGASTGAAADITPYPMGWYRCRISGIPNTGSGSIVRGVVRLINAGGNESYAGDNASGVYLWGAQLEAGSFPTSYIATAASQVTRAADLLSIPVSAFAFNDAEGTLLLEARFNTGASTPVAASLGSGSGNNYTFTGRVAGAFRHRVVSGGTDSFLSDSGTATGGQPHRIALAYRADDFAGCFNAGAVATDASGGAPAGITALVLGGVDFATSTCLNGHLRQVAYFPRRLANTDLQHLTQL